MLTLLLTRAVVAVAGSAEAGAHNTATGVEYVGSKTCGTCHQRECKAWENSLHAHMVRPIAKGDFKKDPKGAKVAVDKTSENCGHRYEQASCSSCRLLKTIGAGSVTTHTFEAIPPAKSLQYGKDDRGRLKMPNACTTYCHKTADLTVMDASYKKLFRK